MSNVIIELREHRERQPARAGKVEAQVGDRVLVSTPNGLEAGLVVECNDSPPGETPEIRLVRLLNKDDRRVIEENKKLAEKAFPGVSEEIEKENLKMKLTKVAYTYDRQKLFVYYTAGERVDFRNLIKSLGAKFKVRIQMVQIGIRDEAALTGGIGLCGRIICCHTFIRDMESVNIDMARDQQLSLNPENISGCCGRLLCCLRYENEFYRSVKKFFPDVGEKITTPEGKGEVVNLNYMKEKVSVKLKNGAVKEYGISEIRSGVKGAIKKWIK